MESSTLKPVAASSFAVDMQIMKRSRGSFEVMVLLGTCRIGETAPENWGSQPAQAALWCLNTYTVVLPRSRNGRNAHYREVNKEEGSTNKGSE
jgi:hypothetical protein